jgi:2-keto-3-deoxy-galactonokinase
MSLRGRVATEPISQGIDNSEIATLPPVARNDKKGMEKMRGEELKYFLLNLGFQVFSSIPKSAIQNPKSGGLLPHQL